MICNVIQITYTNKPSQRKPLNTIITTGIKSYK